MPVPFIILFASPFYYTPESEAIKALYRTLAKRLHPDRSELEETLRERRWNELQDAYNNQNLEGLQRIEAVCDVEDVGGLSISSVWRDSAIWPPTTARMCDHPRGAAPGQAPSRI